MRASHLVLALLVVLVWGLTYIAINICLLEFPPLFLSFMRFFLTSIPAIFFVPFPSASFKMVFFYGLFMFALQFTLLFAGMATGVTPAIASLLLQTQMFFTVLLAVLFLNEKIDRWQVVGGILSFSGIAFIGVHIKGEITLTGFLMIMGSALCWSIGNLISKKVGKVNIMALVVWASLIAWPPLLLLSFIFEGAAPILDRVHDLSWFTVGSLFYITYLATLFGFGSWSWLLNHYHFKIIAPFSLLVPITAMVSSAWILGEALQSWKIIAGLIVIAGLCVNLLGQHFNK